MPPSTTKFSQFTKMKLVVHLVGVTTFNNKKGFPLYFFKFQDGNLHSGMATIQSYRKVKIFSEYSKKKLKKTMDILNQEEELNAQFIFLSLFVF